MSLSKKNNKYTEAITLLENHGGRFPENEFEIFKELALLYCQIGQYETSLEIWDKGHQKGFFFGLFPHFSIYEPFKQYEKFSDIATEDDRLRKLAIANSKSIFEVNIPENYNNQKSYPLILILHGGGSSIEHSKKYWNSPKIDKDFIKVFIQSYLYMDMNTFSWGIKDVRARKEVRECFDEIIKNYLIDTSNLIISGISAGGYTAMDLCIHEILPVKDFIAVCPETEPDDYDEQHILNVSKNGIRGVIITGEKDHFLNQQKEVHALLKNKGIPVQFNIISRIGHEYPENFGIWIDTAIKYIQDPFPILEGRYLGQKEPDVIPEVFAPGVVSTSGKEFGCTFSPDLREFYFTRNGGEMNLRTNTIMFSKVEDGQWTRPKIAPFSGKYFDFEPHITPDGEILYFGSRRPVDENCVSTGMHQWYLEKTDTGWSAPKLLGSPIIDYPAMYISVAKNGNMYFSVDTEDAGIWMTEIINGLYQEPKKLPEQINHLPAVLHPFIAPDESYIVFDAQPNGQAIDPDIFVSFRSRDGSWSEAESLGYYINVTREMCPSVSPDGRFLFFSRDGDIYWVNAKIILDKKPYLQE